MEDDPALRAEAEAFAAELRKRRHRRSVRQARVSRVTFVLAIVSLTVLAVTWAFGALDPATSGFRLLALATVTLFGLSLLTGALSAVVLARLRPDGSEADGSEPEATGAGDQPKKVRPTS